MRILGYEIQKAKKYDIPEGNSLQIYSDECLTKCNNQLRGVINEKAKEYNQETLMYYMGLLIEKAIEFGIELEETRIRNEKLQK